ncbi:MAG: cell division protein ZapB [Desulfovibrionaceae bacterium]|nr:cell division protein ZapB [Desulfovibrionaceae bacterium]
MDMELLDLLEDRIATLITELNTLRETHRNTLAELDSVSAARTALEEENRALKETLTQEKEVKETVSQRIDRMLSQLDSIDAPN